MHKKILGVIIGRFQPVHNYHVECLLKPALEECDHVGVLLGSSYRARDMKNPFTYSFRSRLILTALGKDPANDFCSMSRDQTLSFTPIKDYPYNTDRWVINIQQAVADAIEDQFPRDSDVEVVLYGTNKDDTTWYLELFPQYSSKVTEGNPVTNTVGATDIRNSMYAGDWDEVEGIEGVGESVTYWLRGWAAGLHLYEGQPTYQYIVKQWEYLTLYKAQFRDYPYPPIFQTVDNVCIWNGHVLLIKRKSQPGKGLWALPGGFLNANDFSIRAGALRELREETQIKFIAKSGKEVRLTPFDSWVSSGKTFDHPGRSLRGRTITTAFRMDIPREYDVVIEAADDAADARWFPLHEVLEGMDYELFEDHQAIIANLTLHR